MRTSESAKQLKPYIVRWIDRILADGARDLGTVGAPFDTIYADTVQADTIIGVLTGAEWEVAGNPIIDANQASATSTVYIVNQAAGGVANLDVENNIIVGGLVDGVDIAAHAADANAHHNQGHVLATAAGLGADHTVSGLTAGHVLRASGATAAAFAQLAHGDLSGIGSNSHSQIDSHIANTSNPHSVTAAQLGLVIGTDVQAWDANLDQIAALAVTDGNIIVGNGSAWIVENGDTARTSLGLGTGDSPEFASLYVSDTRAVDTAPSGYDHEVAWDFKLLSALSAPGSGTYGGLMTFAPWKDNTGDAHHQMFWNEGGIYWRQGQPDSASWGSWVGLAWDGISEDFEFAGNLALSALTASRLVATNGSKNLASVAALTAWIATASTNRVTVTDDGDGSVTLSGPQDIHAGASPTFADLTLSAPSAIYALNHDQFANFVANEHIDHTTVSITAGAGLTGGGTIAATRTVNVGQGAGITVNADDVALTTPGTLTVSTSNSSTGNHTHAITSSSNPGAAASILASDGSGFLTLVKLSTDTLADRSGGNLTISPAGDVVFDPTGNDLLPATGYDLNIGSLSKKYLTLHAAELWVETLVAQETIATIGGRVLVGPTTTLTRDLGSGDTTIYVKHNQMASGDRAYMEANGSVEFFAITSSYTEITPNEEYSYSVTRDLDGTGANQWYAGDAIFNTGTTGDGWIDLYSVQSMKAGVTQAGPAIVGNVRNSATFNDWGERWAIGNLNGIYGYGVDTYGAAFGEYASGKANVTIDATNGLRLRSYTTDILQIKNSDGRGYFVGPMYLDTAGGIYQGTGTFGSPTTGLKIWNDSGIGRIAGYNASTLQWYADTDGKLYAAAGDVQIGEDGITITPGVAGAGTPDKIKWDDWAWITAYTSSGYNMRTIVEGNGANSYYVGAWSNNNPATITINAQDLTFGNESSFVMQAGSANHEITVTTGTLDINAAISEFSGRVDVAGNVNAGGAVNGAYALNVSGDSYLDGDLTVDTDTLHVDAANNRVGIGTTGPGAKLDVVSSGISGIVSDVSTTNYALEMRVSGVQKWGFYTTAADAWALREIGVQDPITVLKTSGNVGIGTAGPGRLLELSSADNQLRLRQAGGDNYTDFLQGSTGLLVNNVQDADIQFRINGSDVVTFETGGNVGIGTTGPGYKLDVSGNVRLSGNVGIQDTPDTYALKVNGDMYANRIGLGTAPDTSYRLKTDSGDSYLGGDVEIGGDLTLAGWIAKARTLNQSVAGAGTWNTGVTIGDTEQWLVNVMVSTASGSGLSESAIWLVTRMASTKWAQLIGGAQDKHTVVVDGSYEIDIENDLPSTTLYFSAGFVRIL